MACWGVLLVTIVAFAWECARVYAADRRRRPAVPVPVLEPAGDASMEETWY